MNPKGWNREGSTGIYLSDNADVRVTNFGIREAMLARSEMEKPLKYQLGEASPILASQSAWVIGA